MGSQVTATCQCGLKANILIGGGMANSQRDNNRPRRHPPSGRGSRQGGKDWFDYRGGRGGASLSAGGLTPFDTDPVSTGIDSCVKVKVYKA